MDSCATALLQLYQIHWFVKWQTDSYNGHVATSSSKIDNIHFTLKQITLIMGDKVITTSRSFITGANIYTEHNKIRWTSSLNELISVIVAAIVPMCGLYHSHTVYSGISYLACPLFNFLDPVGTVQNYLYTSLYTGVMETVGRPQISNM